MNQALVRPRVVIVDGVPMSGLLAEAADPTGPKATVVALHGGGTSSSYFDCPGHPQLSLLRLGATLGFTVVALDRPGHGSSAPYPEAMQHPEQRVDLAFGAIDRMLDQRPRGAGLFLMGHSGGCELVLRMATSPRAADLLGVELGAPDGATTLPPRKSCGWPRYRIAHPGCASCCGSRCTCTRTTFGGVSRTPRQPPVTNARWPSIGRTRTFRRSHRACGCRCGSPSASTTMYSGPTRAHWPKLPICFRPQSISLTLDTLGPGTISASDTPPPTTTARCCPSSRTVRPHAPRMATLPRRPVDADRIRRAGPVLFGARRKRYR
ncbi:alpha/beta hydrolase [Mycobacterium marinum]|uniref:alpha/beta hydrolase n=1 Tax=Mycobacterium marinum TaxID=1781 RepID=UPI00356273A6